MTTAIKIEPEWVKQAELRSPRSLFFPTSRVRDFIVSLDCLHNGAENSYRMSRSLEGAGKDV